MANESGPQVRKREAGASRTDRRVERTERALGAALVELMVAGEFEDISVQELLDRADVGRATFYAHFRNKHDLLLSETERFCRLLDAHFQAREHEGRRLAPVAELFAHVADFDHFQRAVARSGLREVVYGLLTEQLARTIERRIGELRPEADAAGFPRAATARLLAAALMELMRWWMPRAVRPTAREMDARFHAIAWGGLASLDATDG